MGATPIIDWQAEAASALEWWRAAGVDVLVEDAPRDWLAAPVAAPAAAPIAAPAADVLPETAEAFAEWRLGPGAPEASWRGGFVASAGPAGAPLMILTDCPDADDAREGRLLAGDAGRLFDRMLAAIGFTRDQVLLASVCAKRPVAGRVPPETAERLHQIARRHVALAVPKRVLLMGDAASRAITGTIVQQARGRLHPIDPKENGIEAVATFHPRFLVERPQAKAEAWKDLQLLMSGFTR